MDEHSLIALFRLGILVGPPLLPRRAFNAGKVRALRTVRRPAAVLFLASLGFTACMPDCPSSCPPAATGASVFVSPIPPTGLSGVEAVLAGPVTETLVCQLADSASGCSWPATDPVVAGAYSLQVSAPGYETVTVDVQVSVGGPDRCGCPADAIEPAYVSLVPTVCPDSIYSWYPTGCAPNSDCRFAWADVLANPICVPFESTNLIGDKERLGTCGDYDVAMYAHVDSEWWYYYDHTTGQLVEVFYYYFFYGNGEGRCAAGPPGGIPSCPSASYSNVCGQDGGTDGAPTDAAIDGGTDARG